MKTILSLIYPLAGIYLLFLGLLYLMQRTMLYYPVPAPVNISAETISFDNEGVKLQGWRLNRGQPRALVYFGGNAETITGNISQFKSLFSDYTVYLVNYRGYGDSEGKPTEAALFSDALAIYDQIRQQHSSISLFGRSLGSGVAVYLARHRQIDQLILLTPYDSLAEVAQTHYPMFPARYLMKDRFDSVKYAAEITTPVLIVTAESDRVVPKKHAEILRDRLTSTKVTYRMIAGAGHNDVSDFPAYREAIERFIEPGY
ncbi:MAG: alpha/beta hydrolase [Proteobacteria bacterium]|nr:alpha/beta hydrolase [Pseudomonadota bacterium]